MRSMISGRRSGVAQAVDACLKVLGPTLAAAAAIAAVYYSFWLFQHETAGISLLVICLIGALALAPLGFVDGKGRAEKLLLGAAFMIVGALVAPLFVGLAVGIYTSGG